MMADGDEFIELHFDQELSVPSDWDDDQQVTVDNDDPRNFKSLSLQECKCEDLEVLISSHTLFDGMNKFKYEIIGYLKQNKIDGPTLTNMSRKQFIEGLIAYVINNEQFKGDVNKVWDILNKYKSDTFCIQSVLPTAKLHINTIEGLKVMLDASQSRDMYNNQCVSYEFDFGDGTSPVITNSPTISHTYAKSGTYIVAVAVYDGYKVKSTAKNVVKINESEADLVNSLMAEIERLRNREEVLQITNKQLVRCYQQKCYELEQIRGVHDKLNPNKKKKKKKKKKGNAKLKHGDGSYDPPSSTRAIGNIEIPRELTQDIIPSLCDVGHIDNLYSYMDKLSVLSQNEQDDTKCNIGDVKVMDYDFHAKYADGEIVDILLNQKFIDSDHQNKIVSLPEIVPLIQQYGDFTYSLYCKIRRQDETLESSRGYKWKMDNKLYNESHELQYAKLRPSDYMINLKDTMDRVDTLLNIQLNHMINKLPISSITCYNEQNVSKSEEMRWTISPQRLREYFKNNQKYKSIPITMFNKAKNEYHTEFAVVIKGESDTTKPKKPDFVPTVKYDPISDRIFLTGFHHDKQMIKEHHQLAMPYEHNRNCSCLDDMDDSVYFTNLTIGHVNQQQKIDQNLLDTILNAQISSPVSSISQSSQYPQSYINSSSQISSQNYFSSTPSFGQISIPSNGLSFNNINQNDNANSNCNNNNFR